MDKTINERLFEQIMRAPHVIRRAAIEANFGGEMPEDHHGHGPNPAFARERVLCVISSYEGGVRQKILTEELRVNPSSVSELISKLENDGYVKRTVDPTDRRATLITLTELGEARTAELADERNERLDKAFGTLTDEEKEQLIALLEKLTGAK